MQIRLGDAVSSPPSRSCTARTIDARECVGVPAPWASASGVGAAVWFEARTEICALKLCVSGTCPISKSVGKYLSAVSGRRTHAEESLTREARVAAGENGVRERGSSMEKAEERRMGPSLCTNTVAKPAETGVW